MEGIPKMAEGFENCESLENLQRLKRENKQ
jgi:hypothetical protein